MPNHGKRKRTELKKTFTFCSINLLFRPWGEDYPAGYNIKTNWPIESMRVHSIENAVNLTLNGPAETRLLMQEVGGDIREKLWDKHGGACVRYTEEIELGDKDYQINKCEEWLMQSVFEGDRIVFEETFQWVSGNEGKGFTGTVVDNRILLINVHISYDKKMAVTELRYVAQTARDYAQKNGIRSIVIGGDFNMHPAEAVGALSAEIPFMAPKISECKVTRACSEKEEDKRIDGFVAFGDGEFKETYVEKFNIMESYPSVSDHHAVWVKFEV